MDVYCCCGIITIINVADTMIDIVIRGIIPSILYYDIIVIIFIHIDDILYIGTAIGSGSICDDVLTNGLYQTFNFIGIPFMSFID